MRRFFSIALVLLVLGTAFSWVEVPGSEAQGSGLANTAWPMFGHDPQHTGRSPYTGPEIPRLKWSYAMARDIQSSPVIDADGTVYVASCTYDVSDGKVDAFGPDGTLKWSYATARQTFTSPAIGADGTIYVCSGDRFYALNPDGTLKWSYARSGSTSPAIGADGTIYVCSLNELYALKPDGTLKWSYDINRGCYSPAIGPDGTVYIGTNDYEVYAIAPDGSLRWTCTVDSGAAVQPAMSSPAVASDGTIYIGSYANKLYALSPDGMVKWSFTTGPIYYASPALGSDGTIYVGSDDHKLYAIRPDGFLKWSYATGAQVRSTPMVGVDGTIYVGSSDNKLYALNSDGTFKWSYTTTGDVDYTSSGAIGSDGTIYVYSKDGRQYAKLYAIGSVSGTTTPMPMPTPTPTPTPRPTPTPIPVLRVTTNDANNVGTTSATLNGNLISLGGASTASVSFEYGLSTIYGNTTGTQSIAATGLFNTQLRGLAPGTTYHFRAKATADTTVYGEDRTLTTTGPPLAQVTTALNDAASAISQEKSKGFNVTAAENLLAQAQQAFQTEDYQTTLELASKADKLARDIDQDGVLNENDFAPAIKNIYIYAGASAFAFVLIVAASSVLILRWRTKRAEKERIEEQRRIEEERKRVETERIEREKAEIIGMIEEALEGKEEEDR